MKGKGFFSTLIVATVQYYDYYLYGFMAATLADNLFVDSTSSGGYSQIMKAYLVYALGMLARPIGAIILGRIGDLYGRTSTLKICLIGNSLFSLFIALIPGHEKLGVVAAFILLVCKMCINAFSSAGTDGVRLYIYENIGREKQCLGNGFVIMATQVGALLASSAALIFTLDSLPKIAWRAPFVIGGLAGLFVVFLLNKRDIAKASKGSISGEEVIDSSIIKIIKNNLFLLISCSILGGCIGASYQFNIVFFSTYCFKILKIIDHSVMDQYRSIAIALYMLSAVAAGAIADRFGRRKVSLIAFPIFIIIYMFNTISIAYGEVRPIFYYLSTMCLPFMLTPALAFLKQSIPINIRYRIFSLAHSIGAIVLSSTTPFCSTFLYEKSKISWLPLVYFMMLISTITLMSNILCIKYKANDY
jgi:MFS family permease